ncbi:MAG: ribonuclease HI family protein [Armatimonadota bacterium]
MSELHIYTDGASKGNPGPAGIGVVVVSGNGQILHEIAEYIGEQTNNVAEYTALIKGLKCGQELGATKLSVYVDSELLERQINRAYRVKSPNLKPLYNQVSELIRSFDKVQVRHVRREQNERADRLANEAIKTKGANRNT